MTGPPRELVAGFGPLVETDWLAAELGAPDLRVIECTMFAPPLPDLSGHRVESGRAALDQLRAAFEAAGALDRERVITYCGGAIAACSDAFVLHRLGVEDVGVYAASMQEWARDPDCPMTLPSGEAPA